MICTSLRENMTLFFDPTNQTRTLFLKPKDINVPTSSDFNEHFLHKHVTSLKIGKICDFLQLFVETFFSADI